MPLSSLRKTMFRSGTRPRRYVSGSPMWRQVIERHAGELAERRRGVALRELGAGLHEQDVRVAQDLLRLERALGEGQVGEREVELAVLEQAQQVGGVGLLEDAHLDPGPVLLEAAEEAREDAGADALVDADAERAGGALGERGHVRLGGVELGDDRVGVAEEEAARVRQVDRPRAARAVDEPLPDGPLELGDLLAHRRLRVAELARGARRTNACRPTASSAAEMAQLDPEKSITFHDRNEL